MAMTIAIAWRVPWRRLCLLVLLATGASPAGAATTAPGAIAGDWAGRLERGDSSAAIVLHLHAQGDGYAGSIDWPAMGYLGVDLLGVRREGGRIKVSVPLPVGKLDLLGGIGQRELKGTLAETVRRAGQWRTLAPEGNFSLTPATSTPPPYLIEPVDFRSGDIVLSGSVYAPRGSGRHPAAVFVHGSGDESRADGAFLADRFARAGIVALVYDKRGVGASGGQWRAGSYDELAHDAAAARRALQARADVDGDRVGYVCRSEGCWVSPIAIRSGGAAFLAAISGPAVTVADEDIDSYRVNLRQAGLAEAQMQDAFALVRLQHAVLRGQATQAELRAQAARLREHPWFAALGWEPLAEDDPIRGYSARTIDFDPQPYLKTLGVPSYWLYGSDDVTIPVADSVRRLLSLAVEPRPTIMVLPGADHSLVANDYPKLPGGAEQSASIFIDWILRR